MLFLLVCAPVVQAQHVEDDEDVIFVFVEERPSFPGGEEALYEFLSKNVQYPEAAREKAITGQVLVSFIVEKDGAISNIKIMRNLEEGCGEEVVRVIQTMPRWNPAKQRGKPVRCQFNIPVDFSLD